MQGRKKVVVDWTGGVRVRRSSERDWAGMDGWMDIAYSEYMHERWKLAWLNSDCI